MKKNRRVINKVKNEIIGAWMELTGTAWGLNMFKTIWSDSDITFFNVRSVEIRDDLLEKVDKWLSKALNTASEDGLNNLKKQI